MWWWGGGGCGGLWGSWESQVFGCWAVTGGVRAPDCGLRLGGRMWRGLTSRLGIEPPGFVWSRWWVTAG